MRIREYKNGEFLQHTVVEVIKLIIVKSNEKVKTDVTVKEQTIQLLGLIKHKGIPNITLPADENGNALIDKDKHSDLYDWAVNG